ncbi:putative nucleoside diphosphatase [Hortaea werneckii]|nr:putative nucleoside diphosphatase [Hortaea werneckii]
MGKHQYGAVIDAGSSGSRVYVYEWLKADAAKSKAAEHDDPKRLSHLPSVKTKKSWRKKVHPGISTFGTKPEEVGSEHLEELVDFALSIVPKDEVEDTPIFLLATAGMRLLPNNQREEVLDNVCLYLQKETRFQLPDCGLHIQVIPGETEGLYGWIAANYLLGGFDRPQELDHGGQHNTYGFLDMGGASAQIAFAPNATESEKHADDLKLLRLRRVNGESAEYRVFVTTWLGFGANEARRRYVESLLESYPEGQNEVPDPCLPVGLSVDQAGHEISVDGSKVADHTPHLVGTGKFTECLKRTFPLLEKDVPCDDPPCLLHGQHTPAIDFAVNHFVGVSEYWHTTHEVFAMAHKDQAYDFHTYQSQVTDFCSRDWDDILADVGQQKWGKRVDEQTVEEVCFKASWLINMLHDGIGVPRVGLEEQHSDVKNKTGDIVDNAKDRGFLDPFQAVDKVDGTEVSWTLGKMVLYASSQMPPANPNVALSAVGFGSNIAGSSDLPKDFQYASGAPGLSPVGGGGSSSSAEHQQDWHDRILSSDYSRRIPGLLIFMLILILAVYLVCGKERRHAFHEKLLGFVGRKPSSPRGGGKRRKGGLAGLAGKLWGANTSEPVYDRVIEEGGEDDFELNDIASSSSDGEQNAGSPSTDNARNGRSSGWATPHRALSPDYSRSSPKSKGGYFDAVNSAVGGRGLGITPFERGGLVVRTESKERLAPSIGRSRAGSPSRRSPLTTPFKESLD